MRNKTPMAESASRTLLEFINKWQEIADLNCERGHRDHFSDSLREQKVNVNSASEAWELLMGFETHYFGPLKNEIENLYISKEVQIDLDELLLYGQRLAVFVEPPPEYNDSKGESPDCLPGRQFPCPDSGMLNASVLNAGHSQILARVQQLPRETKLTQPEPILPETTKEPTKKEPPKKVSNTSGMGLGLLFE